MGFIEVSSHPRVGAILIMGVLIKGVCGFYCGEFSSKGWGDFNYGSSYQRSVWVLLR